MKGLHIERMRLRVPPVPNGAFRREGLRVVLLAGLCRAESAGRGTAQSSERARLRHRQALSCSC